VISDEPLSMKKWAVRALLICATLLGICAIFCAIVSIWVGISHLHQDGFWVPVLAGAGVTALVLALYLRLLRALLRRIKHKEFSHIS
jgi:uncharacterized membrane protein HdeD (DUF308 family)